MCARRDVHPREGSYASSIIECEGASTGLGKMLCSGLGFDIQHDGLLFSSLAGSIAFNSSPRIMISLRPERALRRSANSLIVRWPSLRSSKRRSGSKRNFGGCGRGTFCVARDRKTAPP
jgi:hypothetical protein